MKLATALRLGRVSNLPTVWTNILAGLALGGGSARMALPLGLVGSLFYVGGMYLNDAFDHRWDAQHRPERPIPSGEVSVRTVLAAGFGMLAAGLALLAAVTSSLAPIIAGLVLAGLIVLYDLSHKANPVAPLLMALCRVSLYAMAALTVSAQPPARLYAGGAALLLYLVALTAIAKNETKHPRLPKLVGQLIAGISLLDAAVLALLQQWPWAAAAVVAFLLTRRLQRRIAGT